jgi:glycosyltransferase involved in cell wall biosynthesis
MLISTVIICRNARLFIEACVESIRQQTEKTGEIIAVDGHSEDGTAEWLLQQPDVITLRQMGNGIGNARNVGIQAAKGTYISFLDADDVWLPEKLAQQQLCLQHGPDLQAVTGNLVKSNDAETNKWVAMTPGGFLFRRDVFEQFGLFSEQWLIASDHEWLIRAIRKGLRYQTLPDTVLIKGMHVSNISVLQKKRYRAEMMAIMRRQ